MVNRWRDPATLIRRQLISERQSKARMRLMSREFDVSRPRLAYQAPSAGKQVTQLNREGRKGGELLMNHRCSDRLINHADCPILQRYVWSTGVCTLLSLDSRAHNLSNAWDRARARAKPEPRLNRTDSVLRHAIMNLSLLTKAAGCFPQLCKAGEKLWKNVHSERCPRNKHASQLDFG